ncbi:mucin-2 [Austrofundulus limnaeus]|uniref:Mucin-2 n=1 Tax=Austrofundulus limnaeus TaxID=52670 RepID=A0A2I4AVP0_AUSLI|nr:PREDICTED: mucin-2-like [Austrofundulus limnaeus]
MAFSQGASPASCKEMVPGHIRAHPLDPEHSHITVQMSASSYLPGQLITVTIRSSRDFMGFLLQARNLSGVKRRQYGRGARIRFRSLGALMAGGSWILTPPGTHTLHCLSEGDTITHSDKQLKRNLSFVWRAPDVPMGDIRFIITVVQSYFIYWAGIESAVVHDGSRTVWSSDENTAVDGGSTISTVQEKRVTALPRVNNSSEEEKNWTQTLKPTHGGSQTLNSFKTQAEVNQTTLGSDSSLTLANYSSKTNTMTLGDTHMTPDSLSDVSKETTHDPEFPPKTSIPLTTSILSDDHRKMDPTTRPFSLSNPPFPFFPQKGKWTQRDDPKTESQKPKVKTKSETKTLGTSTAAPSIGQTIQLSKTLPENQTGSIQEEISSTFETRRMLENILSLSQTSKVKTDTGLLFQTSTTKLNLLFQTDTSWITSPSKTPTTSAKTQTTPPKIPTSSPKTQTTSPKTLTTLPKTITTSPNTRTISPNTQTTSTRTQTTSPKTQTTSPKTPTASPKTTTTSPNTRTISPNTQTTSTRTQTTLSKTQTTSPKTPTTSPKTTTTSLKTTATSPNTQTTSPKTQTTSLNTRTTCPKTQTTSPKTQTTSPKTQTTSSKTPTTSPKTPTTSQKIPITSLKTPTTSPKTQTTSPKTLTTSQKIPITSPKTLTTSPKSAFPSKSSTFGHFQVPPITQVISSPGSSPSELKNIKLTVLPVNSMSPSVFSQSLSLSSFYQTSSETQSQTSSVKAQTVFLSQTSSSEPNLIFQTQTSHISLLLEMFTPKTQTLSKSVPPSKYPTLKSFRVTPITQTNHLPGTSPPGPKSTPKQTVSPQTTMSLRNPFQRQSGVSFHQVQTETVQTQPGLLQRAQSQSEVPEETLRISPQPQSQTIFQTGQTLSPQPVKPQYFTLEKDLESVTMSPVFVFTPSSNYLSPISSSSSFQSLDGSSGLHPSDASPLHSTFRSTISVPSSSSSENQPRTTPVSTSHLPSAQRSSTANQPSFLTSPTIPPSTSNYPSNSSFSSATVSTSSFFNSSKCFTSSNFSSSSTFAAASQTLFSLSSSPPTPTSIASSPTLPPPSVSFTTTPSSFISLATPHPGPSSSQFVQTLFTTPSKKTSPQLNLGSLVHPNPKPFPNHKLDHGQEFKPNIPNTDTKPKRPSSPSNTPDRERKYPDINPRHSSWELGMLLGCSAGLGMVLVVGVRYVYRQACGWRTQVTLNDQEREYGRGLIQVQECGDLVRVRKIRENSFVLLTEYDVLAPPGN